ncbi:hypothetical protein [uncultured Oscillibacter sp.]|jgi:hypothetical protein|uniref:hypothetical protein n=1 Tax=uncultured Oscillibacter sp. TaxID=876091 RepID=UPI0025E0941D|nr:hypothetical protein [uncultured Oscillibacter sp.]
MKNLTMKAVDTVLYASCGALFLWAAWDQEIGFYVLTGVCLLALAAWEGWAWVRDCRAGRNGKCEWTPSMTVAFLVVAVLQVHRAVTEPDSFHTFLAVSWVLISAIYAVRTLRVLRAEKQTKEEAL